MFRHFITGIYAATFLSLSTTLPAAADDLPGFWQQQRDAGNALTDRACDGETAAIRQVWEGVEGGDPVLLNNMNWLRKRCKAFLSVSRAEAMGYVRQSAELGYPVALKVYGEAMLTGGGDGVPDDPEAGAAMLGRAARGGFGEAAVILAAAYADGRRVPRDLAKAAEMLAIAEDEGVKASELRLVRGKVRRIAETEQARGNAVPEGLVAARQFAALAVSISDGGFGFAHDFPDPAEARARAQGECEARGGEDCQIKLFGSGKGCMAYHYAGGSATAHGWAVGATRSAVEGRAAQECRKRNGGSACGGSAWVCNDRTEAPMDVLLRAPMPEASAAPVAEGGCYARLMQFCSNFLNATYDGQKLSSVTIHGLPKQPIALEGCGTDRAKEVNLDEGGNWGKRNRHAGAISDAKRAEITGVMRDFRSKVLAAYPRCESRGTRVLLRTNPITDETIRAWKEDASEPNSAMRVLDYALP